MSKSTDDTQNPLVLLKNILDDKGLVYWLDFGTLLFVVRDHLLVMNGDDIDLGIFREDVPLVKSLVPVLERNGFMVSHVHSPDNLQFTKQHLDLVYKIDFNIYERNGDCFVHQWDVHDHNILGKLLDGLIKRLHRLYLRFGSSHIYSSIPSKFFTSFDKIRFLDMDWQVPKDVERYLGLHYGDWLKPQKHWDWVNDDKTITKDVI